MGKGKREVTYVVSTYLHAGEKDSRCGSPAAVNLSEYIISDMVENGLRVSVVSQSWSLAGKGWFHGKKTVLSDSLSYRFFSSFGYKNEKIKQLWSIIQLGVFLFFKGGDRLVVYHSGNAIRYALAMWRLSHPHGTLILQIGEVYSDVFHKSQARRMRELSFLGKADRYIFSSKELEELVNQKNKPSVVIQGTYRGEEVLVHKKDVNTIHIVYAGTLNPEKGARVALMAALSLPSKYCLHILGNDDKEELALLRKKTVEIRNMTGEHADVRLEGVLFGDEYLAMLQQCQIGLVPQSLDADFNVSSFPSKIFSYLANGLRVLSTRIPAIENSSVGKYISYYDDSTPRGLANAILGMDVMKAYDGRAILRELHYDAVHALDDLLR